MQTGAAHRLSDGEGSGGAGLDPGCRSADGCRNDAGAVDADGYGGGGADSLSERPLYVGGNAAVPRQDPPSGSYLERADGAGRDDVRVCRAFLPHAVDVLRDERHHYQRAADVHDLSGGAVPDAGSFPVGGIRHGWTFLVGGGGQQALFPGFSEFPDLFRDGFRPERTAYSPFPVRNPGPDYAGILRLSHDAGGVAVQEKGILRRNRMKDIINARCGWAGTDELYIKYHDEEWGVPNHNDRDLFELLILEGFQAGLSWITVLKKREAFRKAFDNFDVTKVSEYDEEKINALLENKDIIRSRGKITAAINNAKIFIEIQKEFGSFSNYIWGFTDNKVIKNTTGEIPVKTELSDMVSKDLKKRGMKYTGSVIIYSYLQAIGVVNDHDINCYKY